MVLPAAISCLVIGNEYANDPACSDGNYTVNLIPFLIVAGVSQLAAIGLLFCLRICCFEIDEDIECEYVLLCIFSIWILFDIIWAVIGMVIYCNEMSDKCRNQSIGIMIVSWSIIQFVFCMLTCIAGVIMVLAVAACFEILSSILDDEFGEEGDCLIM